MTSWAPSTRALSIASWPTGPAPQTATTSLPLMSHISAPIQPVGRMSDRKSTCSSERSDSIRMGPTSANGTRTYSACPPAYPPVRCEYPNRPDIENPYAFSDTTAFGFELSQHDQSCFLQNQQFPHAIVNGTITRSPFLSLARSTPGPTSSTIPMNSCPRMSPFCMPGMKPSYRCRSDPQMQVLVTRTIASRGLRIVGSGTLSTLTL